MAAVSWALRVHMRWNNFMNEIAGDVTDPETGISVLERKRDRDIINAGDNIKTKKELLAKKTMSIGALGSGSDYSPFIQHLGIPCFNLGFGGEDRVANTILFMILIMIMPLLKIPALNMVLRWQK